MSTINIRWNTSVGEPPCDGCPNEARCADFNLACKDYAVYSYSNYFQDVDRNPTRKQYEAIYGAIDDVA